MRVLMLVWTDVAHDARVLREMDTVVAAGHTVHVVGRAVPPDWQPPAGVTWSSAEARSPFRPGGAPSTERRADRLPGEQPRSAGARGPRSVVARLSGPVRRALRWLLLPEHVVLSLRSWTRDAYADASAREFDLVHAHDFTALPLGARLADEHGVPFVYDAHEWWPGRARHGRWEPLRRRREAALERRLATRAAAVLTVSEGIAERYRHLGVRDVTVIRNTFPLALDGPSGTHLDGVLYAGRVAVGRDLATALAAAPRLGRRRLVLMGPVDPGFLPPADVPPGVELRPAVPVEDVDAVLREVGAALVSLEDTCDNHRLALPNKVFQAVRAGVPVVAADLPELARLVRAHGLGTLYRPGDPGSLVAAVAALAEGYDGYVGRVVSARESLRWEADSARLREVYERLAAAGPRGRPSVLK